MPVPFVIAAIPAIVVWSRNALAVGGLIALVSENSVEELWATLKGLIVAEVARLSGLNLDPDNPFTDASISNAVGEKIGIPLRSLKDRAIIKEDLDYFAVGLISEKSGYQVRSVTNVAMLKEDFLQIGCAELSNRLGLPAGVMPGPGAVFDAEEIKTQLLVWAKAELMTQINDEVAVRVADIVGAADLEAVAADLNTRLAGMGSVENVTARQLAVKVSSMMATAAVVDYQKFAGGASKLSRRRASLRAAQAKFRAAHGNRQVYVPLGMAANVG